MKDGVLIPKRQPARPLEERVEVPEISRIFVHDFFILRTLPKTMFMGAKTPVTEWTRRVLIFKS